MALRAGGWSVAGDYIYTNFMQTGAYRAWPSVRAGSVISDPSAFRDELHGLTNMGRSTGIRLYDLEFDQDYVVVVVGVDKAGNEGPAGASSWATNNTIKFALTRGWTMPKDEALASFPGRTTLGQRTDVDARRAWRGSRPA
jgi:hypothetical protein